MKFQHVRPNSSVYNPGNPTFMIRFDEDGRFETTDKGEIAILKKEPGVSVVRKMVPVEEVEEEVEEPEKKTPVKVQRKK